MRLLRTNRPEYSAAEYWSDAIVHLLALVAAIGAVPVLVTLAVVWRGDAPAIVGTTVYGITLISMILCSALYNTIQHEGWTGVLKRLDHSAIYFKIAGTYTPFTLLSGGYGMSLLAGLWGAALAGTSLKVLAPHRFRWFAIGLYLAMGWVGIIAGWEIFAGMSPEVLALVILGGLLYTAGVCFYLFERMLFHNTIWHVFVMSASVVLFAAVAQHLADTSVTMAASAR